jgi:hypothetical protein
MGKKERVRGRNFEYRVVRMAQECGLPARRIVLSGSAEEKGDVEIAGFKFECKYRGNGFAILRQWVDKALSQGLCGVILGGYRLEPLVVMPLRHFLVFMRAKKRGGGEGVQG